jgi:hypothetical protein
VRIEGRDSATAASCATSRAVCQTGEGPQRVEAGDIVLLPHGTGHVLVEPAGERSGGPAPLRPRDELPLEQVGPAVYRLRGAGPGARL